MVLSFFWPLKKFWREPVVYYIELIIQCHVKLSSNWSHKQVMKSEKITSHVVSSCFINIHKPGYGTILAVWFGQYAKIGALICVWYNKNLSCNCKIFKACLFYLSLKKVCLSKYLACLRLFENCLHMWSSQKYITKVYNQGREILETKLNPVGRNFTCCI